MTLSQTLKQTTANGYDITARIRTDKYSAYAEYSIAISRNDYAVEVIPAARTTWRKKFNQLVKDYGR